MRKSSEGGRGQTPKAFKDSREVALVRKACVYCDLGKGNIGTTKLATSVLDPELANVIADGASKMSTKSSCKMGCMNTNLAG